MAKEYISRDEMVEQTKARVVLGAPRFNTGLEAAIEVATSIPAADVAEVRHGLWEFEADEYMSWCTKAICTSCKQVVADNVDLTQTWGKRLFLHDNLYCPRCGAKMDGGQDE